MTEYLIYRFEEIGIRDAQNLAYVDINYLFDNIEYSRPLLLDFIAQSLLLVHFPNNFRDLQQYSIRNIICFISYVKRLSNDDTELDAFCEKTKIPKGQVLQLLVFLHSGELKTRVNTITTLSKYFDEDERNKFKA